MKQLETIVSVAKECELKFQDRKNIQDQNYMATKQLRKETSELAEIFNLNKRELKFQGWKTSRETSVNWNF